MDLEQLKSTYPKLLRKYLFEGKEEEALYEAYKLGKQCFEAKISIEEITNLHAQSLENILKTIPKALVHDIVLKSSNLLIEFSIQFGLVCQNYFETLRRTDERIRNALYQAGEALTTGLDIQKMLLVVLNLVKNLTDAAGCAIILFDEEKVIEATAGLDAEEDFFKHALFEQVAKEGKAGFIYDLKEEKAQITLKDGRELRSILAMPVNFKGKTMGVLGICLTQPHRYEEEEINLLTSFARQAGIAIENTHLFSELQRRIKTIECLYDIDRVVSKSLVLEETLKSALSKAIEVIGADSGSIHLLDEKGDLVLKIQKGLSQEFASAINKIKMGEGVTGMAAIMQKPETLDIARYPSYELLPHLEKEGIVSLASTPLIAKGRVLGAMTFTNRKQRIFSKDDLDILASIGSQIGVAIENARLFSELQRHDKTLEALYAIESVVSRSLNLEEIFNVALSKALEVTDSETGTLYSLDGEVLRLEAIIGLSPEFKEKALIRKMGEGIPGIAAQSKKPVTMDISQFPSPTLLPYVKKEGLVSFIGTPLMSKEKVVGALSLGTKKKRIFTQDDLDLMLSIGNVIGIAIENAQLYKEVKDKAEHIGILYGIARAVKASLDIDEVFNVMVGEMRSILSFDRTSICLLRNDDVEVFAIAEDLQIPELRRGTRIHREKSSCGLILDRGAGLIRSIEGTLFYEDAFLLKNGIRSVIQVPLISKGERIGVYSLESRSDAYTMKDLQLVQAIADQIATSVENMRLYQDLKQANLELEKRLKEFEEFHTLAVGRELRMMELKERIQSLEERK